jgi:subtilase family serine protease
VRSLQVEQDDVGLESVDGIFDTPHAVEFGNDLDIRLGVKNVLDAEAHNRMVVHEQCTNRVCRRI